MDWNIFRPAKKFTETYFLFSLALAVWRGEGRA